MRVGIVGGGIVGLFTAYYLLRAGVDATIIDASPIGGRASENNAGFVVSSASKPRLSLPLLAKAVLGLKTPVRVSPKRLVGRAGWFLKAVRSYGFGDDIVAQMARKSLDLHMEFLSREKMDVDLVRGVITAFRRWDDAEKLAKRAGGRLLSEKDLAELGYVGLGGGVYVEEELSVNPVKLYRGLRGRVEELGGKIYVGEAQRIKIQDGRIIIMVGSRSMAYDYIVVSAGSRCGEVCRSIAYNPMIEPARGVALLHRIRGDIVASPALLEDYGVGIAQHGSGFLRITGFFELVGHDVRVSRRSIEWLRRIARTHVKNYDAAELGSIAIGFRPCSADLLPVIGEIPGAKGVYIATGLCRLGVTMSPIAGKIVSSMILGENPPVDGKILDAISPSRFGRARIPG